MFWFYQVATALLHLLHLPPPQVVQAVIYLHKKNVCHRDIKLANVLLVDLQYR